MNRILPPEQKEPPAAGPMASLREIPSAIVKLMRDMIAGFRRKFHATLNPQRALPRPELAREVVIATPEGGAEVQRHDISLRKHLFTFIPGALRIGRGGSFSDLIDGVTEGKLGIHKFPMGPLFGYIPYHPMVAETVLERADLFGRTDPLGKDVYPERIQEALGVSALTVSKADPKWHPDRIRLARTFNRESLFAIERKINTAVDQLKLSDGRTINAYDPVKESAYDAIAELAFGHDASAAQEFKKAWDDIYAGGAKLIMFPLPRPRSSPYLGGTAFVRALKRVEEVVGQAMDRENVKRKEGGDTNSYLARLVDDHLTVTQAAGAMRTFFFAGHDTVTHALTSVLYALGRNPNVRQKIYEEMRGLDERPAAAIWEIIKEKGKGTPFTTAAINEAMRLWGSVHGFGRLVQGINPVNLHGTILEPGESLYVPLLALSRNSQIWGSDARKYKPERFLSPLTDLQQAAFKPFGDGDHRCAGEKLGLLEIYFMLYALAQSKITLDVEPNAPELEIESGITTRFKGGKCPMTVRVEE